MFLPAAHAEFHVPTLIQFVRRNPLGLLISGSPTLQASHIPWVTEVGSTPDALPRLYGHVARMNPQSKAFIEAATAATAAPARPFQLPQEVLVMFQGPVHHYITPKFYTSTKPATGKVVPTWDYAAVQVYGHATIYHDSQSPVTQRYLQRQFTALADECETGQMGYAPDAAWKVADAPESYVALLAKNIIGVDIEVTRMEGRVKMSQEKGEGDRSGVIAGFARLGTEVGNAMAETVRVQTEKWDAKKEAIKAENAANAAKREGE